jgi:hypothetical protein
MHVKRYVLGSGPSSNLARGPPVMYPLPRLAQGHESPVCQARRPVHCGRFALSPTSIGPGFDAEHAGLLQRNGRRTIGDRQSKAIPPHHVLRRRAAHASGTGRGCSRARPGPGPLARPQWQEVTDFRSGRNPQLAGRRRVRVALARGRGWSHARTVAEIHAYHAGCVGHGSGDSRDMLSCRRKTFTSP